MYRYMTHISSKPLSPKTRGEINVQLTRIVKKYTTAMLGELLTSTERIMLAKRLAIIFMLEQKQSYYRIHKTLAVSVSTIKRLHDRYMLGHFDLLRDAFQAKRQRDEFLTFLEKVLQMGMSPRGRGRWHKLYRNTSR